jgi:hypothetical protein
MIYLAYSMVDGLFGIIEHRTASYAIFKFYEDGLFQAVHLEPDEYQIIGTVVLENREFFDENNL